LDPYVNKFIITLAFFQLGPRLTDNDGRHIC
jgi:hypothetical protein